MAIYKQDIVDIDLNKGTIHRSKLNRRIGKADVVADHFGVRVFRDGEAVNLTGVSVVGYFYSSQGGSPITISSGNSVSGNEAVVVLTSGCYTYPGKFCLYIKLTDGTVTSTVRIIDGEVEPTN